MMCRSRPAPTAPPATRSYQWVPTPWLYHLTCPTPSGPASATERYNRLTFDSTRSSGGNASSPDLFHVPSKHRMIRFIGVLRFGGLHKVHSGDGGWRSEH